MAAGQYPNNILPEEQCRFRPGRSTVDMLFVVRSLQEIGRRRKRPLYMCFVDLKKAYDSVEREMLLKVLARAGIPANLIEVIRRFPPWNAGPGGHGRPRSIGLLLRDTGRATRMCYSPCCSTSSSPRSSRSLSSDSPRMMLLCGAWYAWRRGRRKRWGGRRHPLTEYGGQYGGCCMPMMTASNLGLEKGWRE
ncbi:unnamed protein product [Ectocarpus sp. CCAP 1310/34]|nr:unnamed protein product [Ectocarpus sp. CCAP 1310/34]